MLRVLLSLLIVFALAAAWRLLRALSRPSPVARGGGKIRMVKCAVCDLYVPENEAEIADGRFYCGAPHRQLGAGGKPQ